MSRTETGILKHHLTKPTEQVSKVGEGPDLRRQ